MAATLLLLVPEYGLFLIFGVVLISTHGIPAPASVIVLSAGGFAAAEELVLWQVFVASFIAYLIGDHCAFYIARWRGGAVLNWMRGGKKGAQVVEKAENLLDRWGTWAVFLSRTVLSQVGPYVGYISGATQMAPWRFSAAAIPAAALWVAAYAAIGYGFGGNTVSFKALLTDSAALSMSSVGALLIGVWLYWQYRQHLKEQAPA